MNINLIKLISLFLLFVFANCNKNKNDNYELLTSKSWAQIEGIYNGEYIGNKTFYKVMFNKNGQYEFHTKSGGIVIDSTSPDTLIQTGQFQFEETTNNIIFESKIYISADTSHGCDTMQSYIATWQILGFDDNVMKIQGNLPDTTNHTPCFWVAYIGKFYFKPYQQ